jgi:hypothetical protein
MSDFSPYTPISNAKSRQVDSGHGIQITWQNAVKRAVTSGYTYYSDWLKVTERATQSALLELLWTGNIVAAATVQGKLDQVPFDLPIDLSSVAPSGHAYAGDLDAEDLAAEDLGEFPVSVTNSPPMTHIRLKLVVSAGSGEIAGNFSIGRGRTADV